MKNEAVTTAGFSELNSTLHLIIYRGSFVDPISPSLSTLANHCTVCADKRVAQLLSSFINIKCEQNNL